jgi:large subunit ribosomal protein L5
MSDPTNIEQRYREVAVPELMKTFGYRNRLKVPRVEKVVVSMGIGEAARDTKLMEALRDNLAEIVGQKPVITKAKKSIANFKVRTGMPVGCMVTLRRRRMYYFLERLFHVAIPRIRDFRGLSPRSFDGRGNYSLGLTEQLVFPEISYDSIPRVQGMNITVCTTAETDDEARELLRLLGAPLAR